MITTYAGIGTTGYSGDGGYATNATFNNTFGITIDTSSNVFIADYSNNRVRKVNSAGIITTYAGTGISGSSGDNGAASSARLNGPCAVAHTSSGKLYIVDYGNYKIRLVSSSGIITTYAGTGEQGSTGDNGPATSATFYSITDLTLDKSGNNPLLFSSSTLSTHLLSLLSYTPFLIHAFRAHPFKCLLSYVESLPGNLYISDTGVNRIRMINSTSGNITNFCGTGVYGSSGDGGAATSALLYAPYGITNDFSGNVYFSDYYNNKIRLVNSAGIIITYAGTGTAGYSGDGGPATSALFQNPLGVALDSTGNYLYIADSSNQVVRVVSSGIVTTVAGGGIVVGDGGPATSAYLSYPYGLTVDTTGNVYVSDDGNNRIRKVMAYYYPTSQPTRQPTRLPSMQPSRQPSTQPSIQPSSRPTTPTGQPSRQPTSQPSAQPSRQPSSQPSRKPSTQPSAQPSRQPSSQPSRKPSSQPTTQPSEQPTSIPSRPSGQPSRQPSQQPTKQPTSRPSRQPTCRPTGAQTNLFIQSISLPLSLFCKMRYPLNTSSYYFLSHHIL